MMYACFKKTLITDDIKTKYFGRSRSKSKLFTRSAINKK